MGVRVVAHRAMSHWISGDVPLDFRVMAHWILGVLAEESKMRRARPSRASRDRHLPKTIKMHYTVHPFLGLRFQAGAAGASGASQTNWPHPRWGGGALGCAPLVTHRQKSTPKQAISASAASTFDGRREPLGRRVAEALGGRWVPLGRRVVEAFGGRWVPFGRRVVETFGGRWVPFWRSRDGGAATMIFSGGIQYVKWI